MRKRLTRLSASVVFIVLSPAFAAEPESTSRPPSDAQADWSGQVVMAKSPDVVLRERPDEQAPAIALSLVGIWLDVKGAQREWLEVDEGWARAADMVHSDHVVEYFASQLAQKESAFSRLGRARGWLEKNDVDKAQADVSEALRLAPKNARAFYVRAVIAAAQQHADEELANYDRSLQLDPRDYVVLKARGYERSARGDYEGAVQDYNAALELLAGDSWLFGARGSCWANKGDNEKAFADFTEAIRLDPSNARAFSARSTVHALRNEFDEAIADATEAVRLDKEMPDGFAVRGAMQTFKGNLDEALSDLGEAIRLGASDAQTYTNRGRVHYLKGNLDAAVLDYTQAISLKGDNAELYFRRAEIWARKGDHANAIIDLTECLRIQPNNVEACVQRGHLRLESSLDEAMRDFEAALKLNPRHVGALVGQAQVWNFSGEKEKAIEGLTTAIDIAPAMADLYQRRAGIRMPRAEWDLAIDDLTCAVRAEPKNADYLLERGMVWLIKGESQKVIDDCRGVLAMEPRNTRAYSYLASAQSSLGHDDEALQTYTTALEIDPDDAHLRMARASTATRHGKFELALADIARLLKTEGHEAEAYQLRAQVWLTQRKWEKAIADFNEAIQLKPDEPLTLCQRAGCWIELKQFDKAIEDAEEALRLDPKSDVALDARKSARDAKAGRVVVEADLDGLPAVATRRHEGEEFRIVLRKDSKWVGREVLPKTADTAVQLATEKSFAESAAAEQSFPAAAAGVLQVQMENGSRLYLVECWLRTADVIPLEQAEEYFSKQIAIAPTAFAYAMRGRARADVEQIDAAITDCDAALRLDAHLALAHCYRGWARAARFEYALAENDYSEAIRLDPKLAAAYAWRGRARQRLGQTELAIEDFDEALRLFPNDQATQNHRSLASGERMMRFSMTAPPRPRDAEDFYFRAMYRMFHKRHDHAIDDLGEALRLGLKTVDVYSLRAMRYAQRGEFAEAIADYDAALEIEPRNGGLFVNRGLAHGSRGDYATAVADFRRALDCDPQAAAIITDGWRQDGPYQEHIERSPKNKIDGDLPLAYFVRAMMWISKGEDEDAIDDLSSAVRLDPNLAVAFCLRGWLRQKAGQRDEALRDFADALRIDPSLAAARELQQEPPRAEPAAPAEAAPVAEAVPVAEAGPATPLALAGSDSAYQAGAFAPPVEEADHDKLAAATEAVRQDPDDSQAQNRLAVIVMALEIRGLARSRAGRFEEAIRDLDEVIRADPTQAHHFQSRGQIWAESGDYAKALADYQEALRLAERDLRPSIRFYLARIWATCPDAQFRDGKRAVAAAKKALRAPGFTPPIYYDTLAAAYAEAGDFAEAVQWQTKAVETAVGDEAFIREVRKRLELYRAGRPYRETRAAEIVGERQGGRF